MPELGRSLIIYLSHLVSADPQTSHDQPIVTAVIVEFNGPFHRLVEKMSIQRERGNDKFLQARMIDPPD